MQNNTIHCEPKGDEAFQARVRVQRCRQWLVQCLIVILLGTLLWLLAKNVVANLEDRHIRSGFAFLQGSAGFDLGETLLAFTSADAMWLAFANGIINTIRVAICSIFSALIVGVIVGLMRLSAHPILRFLGTAHVEFYRNIPLIIQLFALYMALTELLPMSMEPIQFWGWALLSKAGLQIAVPSQTSLAVIATAIVILLSALLVREILRRKTTELVAGVIGGASGVALGIVVWIIFGWISGWDKPVQEGFAIVGGATMSTEFLALWLGLTMFTSAAIAEIVRAGVLSVRKGQWNAGYALGLSHVEVVSYIIFPQSMRLIVPPLASQFMNLTKNSSLAVVIGYPDLVAVGNSSINVTGQALEVIVIIMAVYLVLNLLISVLMNAINAQVMRA